MGDGTLLEVRNLSIGFYMRGGLRRVVRELSFSVSEGETLCIVGESGCGKSVTAAAILGLIGRRGGKICGGEIFYRGKNLLDCTRREWDRIRFEQISAVFQEPQFVLNPVMTVGNQIAEVLRAHTTLSGRECKRRAAELLSEVRFTNPEDTYGRYPHELSGGMCQRVMIAAAIACSPRLVLADEPTTNLDVTIQARILELLTECKQKHGMSLLFITHDLGVAAHMADSILVMRGGMSVEQGPAREVLNMPRHPYTKELLRLSGF